jgi:hypothetical protein
MIGEFPLRRLNEAVQRDEDAIIAIVRHVFATTQADPGNVLSTGFSYGGYFAHYMLNQHPELFTCLAVRQCNFTSEIMNPANSIRSIYHPVLIVYTAMDWVIVQEESADAIRWYEEQGYKNVAWVKLQKLLHERTPDIAAAFFAKLARVEPNTPPTPLMSRQAIDGNEQGLAVLSGTYGSNLKRSPSVATRNRDGRETHASSEESADGSQIARSEATLQPADAPNNRARPTSVESARSGPQVRIDVSSTVGVHPLLISYTADVPELWKDAKIEWTLNGDLIGASTNGQVTLHMPGDYSLNVRLIRSDGQGLSTSRTIRVLHNPEAR